MSFAVGEEVTGGFAELTYIVELVTKDKIVKQFFSVSS